MRFISLLKGCLSGLTPFVTDLNLIGFLSTDFKRNLVTSLLKVFVFAVGFKRIVFRFAVGLKKIGSGSCWHEVDLREAYSPSESSSLPDSQAFCKSVAVLCTGSDS